MNIKNPIQKLTLGLLLTAFIMSFTACSSDDDNADNPDHQENFNPYVLSLAIQGSEGDFTYYTVPFSQVMEGTLDAVGQGIEQPGYYDFTQIGNTIYAIGGLDDVDLMGIRKDETNHQLKTIGNVAFDNSISDLKKADDQTLVSVTINSSSDAVVFHKFDENSITATDQVNVPVSDIIELNADEGLSYSGMEVSGNHLFLAYYISNPETFETTHTDEAQVAVFSYPDLTFQKVITDSRVGPIGGFNIKGGLIKDEQGNIYAVSHSNPANGYSQHTKASGILKINHDETEFDPDYFFDIATAANGGNTAHIVYLGNGKVFAEINTADRNSQEIWSDSPLRSAIINLNDKSVHFMEGVPAHNGEGRRLPLLQDGNQVYLCIPNSDGLYVYKMDINTYTATKGAKIQANFVAGFFKL